MHHAELGGNEGRGVVWVLVKVRAVHLYAAFLGGPVADGRMGEDHEVVFVIADDPIEAKSKAKDKWSGVGRGHVDAVQRVEVVDGFAMSLERQVAKRRTEARHTSPSVMVTLSSASGEGARLLDAVTPRHRQAPTRRRTRRERRRRRERGPVRPPRPTQGCVVKLGRNWRHGAAAVGRYCTGVKRPPKKLRKEHECGDERIGGLARRHEPDEDAQRGEGERAHPHAPR